MSSTTPSFPNEKATKLHNEIRTEWEKALTELTEKLNYARKAEGKAGREFKRAYWGKYNGFLDELERVGIRFIDGDTENSGFIYEKTNALWEKTFQYSSEHHNVWFATDLPAPGGQETDRIDNEIALSLAFSKIKDFGSCEVILSAQRSYPDVLNSTPSEEIRSTEPKTFDQNYKELFKNLSAVNSTDLNEKVFAANALITSINVDLKDKDDERSQRIKSVLAEAKKAIGELNIGVYDSAQQEFLKKNSEEIIEELNYFSAKLVNFIERPGNDVNRIELLTSAFTLQAKVLNTQKTGVEQKVKSLCIESLEEERKTLQDEILEFGTLYNKKQTEKEGLVVEVSKHKETLRSKEEELKNLNSANEEAKKNLSETAQAIKNLEKEIKNKGKSKIELESKLANEKLAYFLTKEIDALVKEHRFLDNGFNIIRIFRSSNADKALANKLAAIKNSINKNKDGEVYKQAAELITTVKEFLVNAESDPRNYPMSSLRKEHLKNLVASCRDHTRAHHGNYQELVSVENSLLVMSSELPQKKSIAKDQEKFLSEVPTKIREIEEDKNNTSQDLTTKQTELKTLEMDIDNIDKQLENKKAELVQLDRKIESSRKKQKEDQRELAAIKVKIANMQSKQDERILPANSQQQIPVASPLAAALSISNNQYSPAATAAWKNTTKPTPAPDALSQNQQTLMPAPKKARGWFEQGLDYISNNAPTALGAK